MAVFFLAIYIAVLFIRPMEWWSPVLDWPLVNYAAVVTLLAGFTAFPRVLDEHMRFTEIPEIPVGVFLLFGVSCSWLYPYWGTGITSAFTTFGKTMLLFAVIVLMGRHPRNFRFLLWTVLLCVAWMALHGHLQMSRGYGFGDQTPLQRPHTDPPVYQIVAFGTFDDPNDLCLAFIIAIPLLFVEFSTSPNLFMRMIAFGLMLFSAYGAWLTNSRGGIVGIFGMIAGYFIARFRGVRRWLLIIMSVGLVTIVMPSRGSQLGTIDEARITAWGDGITAFKQYPIFGVGFGDFVSYTDEHMAAHNSYINALTELGLVGYIPFFLLIFLTMLHLRRAIRLKELMSRRYYFYLVGLYAGLCGYLTAIYFLSRTYNQVLYILLGLTISAIIIACYENNLYAQVFGNSRRDIRRGILWAFLSIPLMWATVLIANRLSGR